MICRTRVTSPPRPTRDSSVASPPRPTRDSCNCALPALTPPAPRHRAINRARAAATAAARKSARRRATRREKTSCMMSKARHVVHDDPEYPRRAPRRSPRPVLSRVAARRGAHHFGGCPNVRSAQRWRPSCSATTRSASSSTGANTSTSSAASARIRCDIGGCACPTRRASKFWKNAACRAPRRRARAAPRATRSRR